MSAERHRLTTDLVYKVLAMIITEFLGTNNTMKVGLHELLDEVNLVELVYTAWLEDIKDRDDVFVMKVSEEFYFTESSKTEHSVVEGSDALDSDFALSGHVDCGAGDDQREL